MSIDAIAYAVSIGGASIGALLVAGFYVRGQRVDERIIASELHYRRLFEAAQDGVLILDAVSGEIIEVNPYLLKLLCYPAAEVIGMQLWQIGVLEDVAASKAVFMELQIKGHIRYENLPLQTRDGRTIAVEFVSTLYTVNGAKVIQCRIRDIVERKNIENTLKARNKELEDLSTSQEDTKRAIMNIIDDLENQTQELKKFQMAVADSSDQIIISDADGIVLYANQAAEKTTGYSVDEIIGTKAGALWGGHIEEGYYQKMWEIIKHNNQPFVAQIENKRKNGQVYTGEIHVSPMVDDSGTPEYFVTIERDITRERAIDKAKTEFVSLASHQIRTPLGIAKWYLEAIREDVYFKNAPTRPLAYINEIYSSNERVLGLVRDLLSVSRIEQGRTKSSPELSDITYLVKNIIKEMNVVARKKKITLKLVLSRGNIPEVSIDPLQFYEVLENLIGNALEYTKSPGRVTVTVDVLDDNRVTISVTDTGVGISEATQPKLFTKFFRSEKAVSTNPDGSGLGLYVVKSFVEGWGGKVEVESKEGAGSRFTITIPMNIDVSLTKVGV